MGRELRRVPANWEHPKNDRYGEERYTPLYERSFRKAAKEWDANNKLWQKGKHPDQVDGSADDCEHYEEWEGERPNPAYYAPYDPDDKKVCIWYQLYETVSEGTPVTPAFERPEDLVEYLVTEGDFWQQSDKKKGRGSFRGESYSRDAAENMVFGDRWAPSGVIMDGQYFSGTEAMARMKQQSQDGRLTSKKTMTPTELRKIMADNGWTQDWLARAMHVKSTRTIRYWLSGQREIREIYAERIMELSSSPAPRHPANAGHPGDLELAPEAPKC